MVLGQLLVTQWKCQQSRKPIDIKGETVHYSFRRLKQMWGILRASLGSSVPAMKYEVILKHLNLESINLF